MSSILNFEWYNNDGISVPFCEEDHRNLGIDLEKGFLRNEVENKSNRIGIRWSYEGTIITIEDVLYKSSLPTPDMKHVICVLKDWRNNYPTKIYNADGSVYLVVKIPAPLASFCGRGPAVGEKAHINELYWHVKNAGRFSMVTTLSYYSCWEKRFFDPGTGEFGDLYDYGYY